MMKFVYFILFIYFFTTSRSYSQKYSSYPDRKLELLIKDSIIIFGNKKWYGGTNISDEVFHYSIINDTLFIKEKTTYGNNIMIAVKKGRYVDFIIEKEGKYSCGILFKKKCLLGKHKSKKIIKSTNIYSLKMVLELQRRLKRLEIFGIGCDDPLPPLFYEHF